MTYEEVRADLAEQFGWTFDTIDNMTFEQIDSARRMGKKSKGIPVGSDKDIEEINRNWRSYYGI